MFKESGKWFSEDAEVICNFNAAKLARWWLEGWKLFEPYDSETKVQEKAKNQMLGFLLLLLSLFFFFYIKGSFSVPCDGPKRGEEQQMFILSDIRNKTWLWANKFKWNDIEVVKWLPWKDLFTITCAEKVSRGYTAQRSYSINLQPGCKHYQWPEFLFCSY